MHTHKRPLRLCPLGSLAVQTAFSLLAPLKLDLTLGLIDGGIEVAHEVHSQQLSVSAPQHQSATGTGWSQAQDGAWKAIGLGIVALTLD